MIKPVIGNRYKTNGHGDMISMYRNETFVVVGITHNHELISIRFDDPLISNNYESHHLTMEEWNKYIVTAFEPQRRINKLSFLYNGF